MSELAERLIAWQKSHGRHDLPWQKTTDAYAIWVSEIMLQQTQVSAVIPYYKRFMARFPDVESLARAHEDEVLSYWSGLGYYSRARNLQRAAQIIMGKFGGRFPQDFIAMESLPGIGRSTAAAIAAFAFGQRQAILDGNVKRVLTRFYAVEGWPGQPSVEKRLWLLAERLLPQHGIEHYTQSLMDLGATLCTRSKPHCMACPLAPDCVARRDNLTGQLPSPRPRKIIPQKSVVMLLLRNEGEILLEKRPPSGIWGGLWSLPEIASDTNPQQEMRVRFGFETMLLETLPGFTHTFTHFRLHITPQPMQIIGSASCVQEAGTLWLGIEQALAAALPAPVRKLLQALK